MSESQPHSLPPAGWYRDPHGDPQRRWWSGQSWTEHVQPDVPLEQPEPLASANAAPDASPEEAAKTVPDLYWSNLLRIRTWWFSLLTPLLVAGLLWIPLKAIGASDHIFYLVFIFLVLLAVSSSLKTQMACRACGRLLAVTRLTGQPEVCRHCHTPTDRALREAQS